MKRCKAIFPFKSNEEPELFQNAVHKEDITHSERSA
jgi:hypothetical protein